MNTIKILINSSVIKHYIDDSNINLETLEKDPNLKHIRNWLNASEQPTFNQLNQLSKKIEVPLGYLLIDSIQKNSSPLLKYRTVLNNPIKKPSRALLDTINDMEDKQAYMREFLIRNNYDKLSFVGKFSRIDTCNSIVKNIREILQINEKYFKSCSKNVVFNYLRNKFENIGILVMKNGIVKTNTHRKLNINEFRAFTLVDDYAPLVFINNRDRIEAKVFALFYEIAHIFLGENNIFNDNNIKKPKYRNKLETLCNNIASELYTSIQCLKIKNYDLTLNKKYENNNNVLNKIGKRFFSALLNDTQTGNIQYTEAYSLSNTNRTLFDKIQKSF